MKNKALHSGLMAIGLLLILLGIYRISGLRYQAPAQEREYIIENTEVICIADVYDTYPEAVAVTDEHIYCLISPDARIIKIDKETTMILEVVVLPFKKAEDMVTDGTYLYVSEWRKPPHILRIRLDNLAEYTMLELIYDSQATELLLVDNNLYVGQGTYIARIDTRSWEQTGNLNNRDLNGELSLGGSYFMESLAAENDYLYACATFDTARLVKVRIDDFVITAAATPSEVYGEGLAVKDGYGYVVCTAAPGRVVKIDLGRMVEVDKLILDEAWDNPKSGVVVLGNCLYILCEQGLVEVDLERFEQTDSWVISGSSREGITVDDGKIYICR